MITYPIRIAISGKICSGKTTLAEHLVQQYKLQRLTFAKYVKELAAALCEQRDHPETGHARLLAVSKLITEANDLPMIQFLLKARRILEQHPGVNYIYDANHNTEIKDSLSRPFLQAIGHGIRQRFHDMVWINTTLSGLDPTIGYVIDDMRYENEYEELKSYGFTTIRLDVTRAMQVKRLAQKNVVYKEKDFQHSTETALDTFEFDFRIDADQPLEVCLSALDKYVQTMIEQHQQLERMTNLNAVNDPRRSYEMEQFRRRLTAASAPNSDSRRHRHHDSKKHLS